jgi:hypothetical protein
VGRIWQELDLGDQGKERKYFAEISQMINQPRFITTFTDLVSLTRPSARITQRNSLPRSGANWDIFEREGCRLCMIPHPNC